MNPTPALVGWDIGGVNTKVARLTPEGDGSRLRSLCLPYEIKSGSRGAGDHTEGCRPKHRQRVW